MQNQQGKNESTIKISTTVYEIIYLWNLSYSTRNSVRKRVCLFHFYVINLSCWCHLPANFVNSYVNTTTKSTKLECTQTRTFARNDGIVCYPFHLNECQISINLCLRCLPCRLAAFYFFRSSNNKRRNAFANFLLANNHHHTTYARIIKMNAEKNALQTQPKIPLIILCLPSPFTHHKVYRTFNFHLFILCFSQPAANLLPQKYTWTELQTKNGRLPSYCTLVNI